MTETLAELRERHGDDLRIVWKDFPIGAHKNARPAPVAARVAFMAKGMPHSGAFQAPEMLDDESYGQIEADAKAASDIGASGTPAFLVQTKSSAKLRIGAQPGDAFFRAIDAALAKAK